MDNEDGLGEILWDLSQARIAPYKNTWWRFSEYSIFGAIWSSLNKEDCNFLSKQNAVFLHDTLLAGFVENAICMKTKDQLHQRESVVLRPRVVLQADSQCGSQDLLVQEARSPWESHQDAESYGETRSNTADYISISTVKLQDVRRPNNVTKLIEMFEKHQDNEEFFEDMSQKQEINKFSEESKQLLVDMNHTEIFEFGENSAKHQCPDCNAFSEIGIIPLQLRKKFAALAESYNIPEDQLRYYFNPCFVIKKNSSWWPKHGVSERLMMFYTAKQMLKKARQSEHGNHPTILSRFSDQEGYRKSLAENNIGEKEVMLFDRIDIERHDFSATRAETVAERQTWDSSFECWWASKASSTATRICPCIETMP